MSNSSGHLSGPQVKRLKQTCLTIMPNLPKKAAGRCAYMPLPEDYRIILSRHSRASVYYEQT